MFQSPYGDLVSGKTRIIAKLDCIALRFSPLTGIWLAESFDFLPDKE